MNKSKLNILNSNKLMTISNQINKIKSLKMKRYKRKYLIVFNPNFILIAREKK